MSAPELAEVSDFLAADPPTPAGVKARLAEHLAILDGFGLRRAFRPAARRVTLSTQAGVGKPDRRAYELALRRLGCGAELADCLSITEDGTPRGCVPGARDAGPALRRRLHRLVGGGPAGTPLGRSHQRQNTELALGVWLEARHGRKLAGLDRAPTPAGANLRVRPPGPARASVSFDPSGRIAHLEWAGGPE